MSLSGEDEEEEEGGSCVVSSGLLDCCEDVVDAVGDVGMTGDGGTRGELGVGAGNVAGVAVKCVGVFVLVGGP